MVFEKLTLVEFHLETDTFEPSATASIGGRESGSGGRSPTNRGGPAGWVKFAPVVALIAAVAAFAVARRRTRR